MNNGSNGYVSPVNKVEPTVMDVVIGCPDNEQILKTKLDEVPVTCVGVPSQAV